MRRPPLFQNVGCAWQFYIAKPQNLGVYPSGAGLHISCQDVKYYESLGMMCVW